MTTVDLRNTEQALRVLRDVRQRLAAPECWHQGSMGRTAAGGYAWITRGDAVAWSLVGACWQARFTRSEVTDRGVYLALDRLTPLVAPASVTQFNHRETTTHADILRVLDAAISEAEGRP